MKKKITIVDKDLNQLVVVADCSSALYQDRGTKLGEQNLLSDTAVTFKVYDGTVQVAVMMADILQVPTKQGTMADIWPTPANPLPDKQLAILEEHDIHAVTVYTEPELSKAMKENARRLINGKSEICRKYIEMSWKAMTNIGIEFDTNRDIHSEYAQLALATARYLAYRDVV